jgi:hypothetical protein
MGQTRLITAILLMKKKRIKGWLGDIRKMSMPASQATALLAPFATRLLLWSVP